jgi:3-hydroxybutyryl-CoA dehydratase
MKFEELYIGQEFAFKKTITTKLVESFAQLSGDFNPIHLDHEFATKSIFKKRIIHGMIIGALFSKSLASDLPGPGSIYINQTMNFLKPIFHDSEIEINIQVSNLKAEKKIVYLETKCLYDGEVCVDGSAILKLLH